MADNKKKNKIPDYQKGIYSPRSTKETYEAYQKGQTVYRRNSNGTTQFYQKDQKPVYTSIDSPIRKTNYDFLGTQENSIIKKLTIPTQKLNYSYNPESVDDVAQMTAWLRLHGNGDSDYEDLAAAVQNPGSKLYQPYWKGRSTQTAAQDFFRENFGYEGAFDDKFFEDYLYLQQYTPRSDATGKLIQPGKKGTLNQWAGYWFTCLDMDRDTQHEVDGEWADLRKNTESRFADFKTMYGREPSYSEFIDLVDISSYNQLSKIDASRNLGGYNSSAVVQLNTGTNYSHEALAGMYYVLCNGGDVSEDRDYFEDAVSYYLEGASEKAAVEDASASVLSEYGYDVSNITDENYAQALSKAAKIGDMEAYAAIERYHWAQNAAPNIDTTDYFGERFGYYHDDAWFDAAGAIYEPIVKSMSLQDGSVQAPTKKDAPIYHAAYQYYLIKKNRGVTDELEAEYKAFTNDVQQYAEECKKYGNSYENYEYHIWNERLNKENYPNLVKYLADDLDTCRPVLIDKAGIENLIKASYDSDSPEAADSDEGANAPEATPSPFPLGHEVSGAEDVANTPQPVTLSEDYLNDQVQASAYEHTKRVDDARNKVESALALARSGATVNINQFAESGVPLTGIIDDDDTNNLIVAMWKELQRDYYEDTLGKKYTDAQIEAIDPVYRALVDGTGCAGDAKITPKALEDLYIQECISETSSSALLGGIATYFLGSGAMDNLIDRTNSENEKAFISAYAFSQGTAIDVVAYKQTFDNLIDKGYTEQAARETAYYESVFGNMHPTKVFLEAEAELSEAANAATQSIQSEEAYPDNQVLSGTIINRLISEGLFATPEKVAEIAAEIHEDLMMGLSELAPSTFNAATKALINDIQTGVVTPQDVSDGFAAAQEERDQRLMAETVEESAETQNSPNGAAAETPEEKPKGNALQTFLDSINAYVTGSKAQEDHSEMFAAIGYDYGGLSIDNRCYEEQGRSEFVDTWNNRIADFVDDTEILTGIEAAAKKYGHADNYGMDGSNDEGEAIPLAMNEFGHAERLGLTHDKDSAAKQAPILEKVFNSDLFATIRAALGGMGADEANERYLVRSAIRTNGIYFTYDEMNALYQAWNSGYITYDGFKEVLNNRKANVTPQTANAAFRASMLEDSNVQRNERITSLYQMLSDIKVGEEDFDTSLLINGYINTYEDMMQGGYDSATIAYELSKEAYAPVLELIGMKPGKFDEYAYEDDAVREEERSKYVTESNYTEVVSKLKEYQPEPVANTHNLANRVDGGYYTVRQIRAIDKLSECVASCGAQGYDFVSAYTPEMLSEVTGGWVDLKSVGLNGSLMDYMDDVFGETWQYPYSNTGMDAVSVTNHGLSSGYQSVLFAIPKALNIGANAIGKVTGLGEDTSGIGNAYKEFEAANKDMSSTRMTSGENVVSTLISMLPKYVINKATGNALAGIAESVFYGAETTAGLTRIADNAMSVNGAQRLVSDLAIGTKESAVGSGTSLATADPSQKLDIVVGAYESYVNNGYVLDAVKLAHRLPYALQEFNYTTDRDLQKGQDIVTSITRGLLNASLELLMPNPLADKPAYSSGDAVSFVNATDPVVVNNRHDAWRAVEAATRSNVLGVPAKTLTGVTQLCDSIFKELRVEMLKDAGEVILDATRDTQFKSEDGFGAYFSSLASNIIGNVGKHGEEYVSKYLSMAASISLINAVQFGVAKMDDFLSNDPIGRIKKLFVDYPDECDYVLDASDPSVKARVDNAKASDVDSASAEASEDSARDTATADHVKAEGTESAEVDTGWKRKPFDYSIFEPQKSDEATGSKYNYPSLERNRRGADPLAEIVEEAMSSDSPSEDLDIELLLTLARLGVTTEALKELAETQPEVLVRVGDALLAQVGSGDPVLQPKTFGEDGTMPRNGVISAQNYAALAEGGKRDIVVEQAIETAKRNYLEQDASLKAVGEAKQKAAREAEEKRQAVIEIGNQIVQQTMSLEGVLRAAAAMNVDFNSPSVRDPMTGLQQSIAALESKQADAQKAADKAIQAAEDAEAKYNDAVQRAEAQFDANVRPGMKDDLEARYDAAQAYIVQRKAQESIAVSEDNPRASGEPAQWESEDGQAQENKYDKRPEYTPELETPASREANLMQELDTRVNSLTTAVKKALKAGETTAATMMTPVKEKTYNALIGIAKRIPAARDLIPMLFKTGYDDGTQQFSDAQGDSKYGTTGYARDNFSGNFDVLYNKFGMIPYAESDDYIVLQNPAASKNGYIYSEHGRKAQGSAAFDDYSAGDGDGKARYYSDPNYLDAKKDYQEASAERAKLQKEAQAKRVALQQGGISPEEKLQLKQDIADADAKIAAWNDRIAIAAGEMQEIKNREDGILKQPYIVIRKSDYAILEGASELESAAASAQAKTADNVYLHAVTDYSRDQLIDMIVEATGVSGDVETKLRANLADKRLYPTETDLATELLQTYADMDAEAISQGKASSVPFIGFQKEADLKQFIAENGGWKGDGGSFGKLRPQKTFRVNTALLHLLGMYKSYASGAAADSYSNPADAALARDIASLNVGSEEEFFGAIFDMYNKYAEPDKSQTGTNFENDGTGSSFAPSDPFARNPKGESKTTYYAPTDTDGKKTLYVNPNRRNYDLNGARKGEAPVYTIAKAENLVRKLYHEIATSKPSEDGNNPDARIIVYENGGFGGDAGRTTPRIVGAEYRNPETGELERYLPPVEDIVNGKSKYEVMYRLPIKDSDGKQKYTAADFIVTNTDWNGDFSDIDYSKQAMMETANALRENPNASPDELADHIRTYLIQREGDLRKQIHEILRSARYSKDKEGVIAAAENVKALTAKRDGIRAVLDSSDEELVSFAQKHGILPEAQVQDVDDTSVMLPNPAGEGTIEASSPDEFALKAAETELSNENPNVVQAMKYSRYVQSDEVSAAIQKAIWKAIDRIATKDMNPLQRANYYSLRADSALAKAPNSGLYQDYQTEVAKAMEEAGIVPTSLNRNTPATMSSDTGTMEGESTAIDTPEPVESASTAIDTTASEVPVKEATEPTEPETPARIAIDTTESEEERSALEELAEAVRAVEEFPSRVEEAASDEPRPRYEPMVPSEDTVLSDDPNAEYSIPFAKSVINYQQQLLDQLQRQIDTMPSGAEKSELIDRRNRLKQRLVKNRSVHFSRDAVVNALSDVAEYDPFKPLPTKGGKMSPSSAVVKLDKALGAHVFGDRTTFTPHQMGKAFGELFDPRFFQDCKDASTHVYEAYAKESSDLLRHQYELAVIENALNPDNPEGKEILKEKANEYVESRVARVKLGGGSADDFRSFREKKAAARRSAWEDIENMDRLYDGATREELLDRHHILSDSSDGLIVRTEARANKLKRSHAVLASFGNSNLGGMLAGWYGGRLPTPIVNTMLGAVVHATSGNAKSGAAFTVESQKAVGKLGISVEDGNAIIEGVLNAESFDDFFSRMYGAYAPGDPDAEAARRLYGEAYAAVQAEYKKYIDKHGNPSHGVTALFDTMERWVDATFGSLAPVVNSVYVVPALEASDHVNAETDRFLADLDREIPSKNMNVIRPDGTEGKMNVREIVGYIMNERAAENDIPDLPHDSNGIIPERDFLNYMYDQFGLDEAQREEIGGYIEYAKLIGGSILQQENDTLIRNGQTPIAMRGHGMYYPATHDNRSAFEKAFGVDFHQSDPPLGVEGSTEGNRSTHEYNQTALQRKGKTADYNIYNAYKRVAHAMFSTIYMTDHVVRLRQFSEAIRGNIARDASGGKLHENASAPGYYKSQPMIENGMGGNSFARAVAIAAMFDRFADNLTGKTTIGTRAFQTYFGRKVNQVMRVASTVAAAKMLGFNVRSALTNALPIARMLCIAPKETLSALAATLKVLFGGNESSDAVQRSSYFLKGRNSLAPEETSYLPEWLRKAMYGMMQGVDNIASGTVVRAFYDVGRRLGLNHEEALTQAEDAARRLLTTKTKAAGAQIFNNPIIAFILQFQRESLNDAMFTAKDLSWYAAGARSKNPYEESEASEEDGTIDQLNTPRRKISKTGMLNFAVSAVSLAVVSFLGNLLLGSKSSRDVAGSAIQAANETDEDAPWYEKGLNAVKAAAIEAFPLSDKLGLDDGYGSGLDSLTPPSVQSFKSFIEDVGSLISELGEEEFDGDSFMKLFDVITGMLPAGTQLSRTAHGVNDLVRGYSTTDSGKVKFPVDQGNPINWFMLPIFGSNSAKNKEAIDYYLGENQSLTQSQSDTYKSLVENGIDPSVAYQSVTGWNDAKSASSYADKAEKMTDKDMGDVMAADAEAKEARSKIEVPSDMAPWAVKALQSDANVQKGVELYKEFGVKTYPVEFKPTSIDGKNCLSVDGKWYPIEDADLSSVEADYKAQYAAAIRRYDDSKVGEAERRAEAEKLEKEISQINTIIKKMIVSRKEGDHNGKK